MAATTLVIIIALRVLLLLQSGTDGQWIYQSSIKIFDAGQYYLPSNPSAQFLTSTYVPTLKDCAYTCNRIAMCQVFDYNANNQGECRLFEGDLDRMGILAPTSSTDSQVGVVQLVPSVFTQFGQPCLVECTQSRYLYCGIASTCQCIGHTYWNTMKEICSPQITVIGEACEPGSNMCREDLNFTCSVTTNQCQFPEQFSLITATTIIEASTPISGSETNGVGFPFGLKMYETAMGENLLVVDFSKNQILQIANPDTDNPSIFALRLMSDLSNPVAIAIDSNHENNLYISDSNGGRVLLFYAMQSIAPIPKVAAGMTGFGGVGLNLLSSPSGLAIDSEENLYISDTYNHRIVLWTANATIGILIAGTGSSGSDVWSLNYPMGLSLDERNQRLYVADTDNNRIQAFLLTGTPPYQGLTVAGGRGAGMGSDQLNRPYDVWVSKITGMIFVADTANHRIQRWSPNGTAGVTIAGDSNASFGVDQGRLNTPYSLTVSKHETHLYVSDTGNQRVQRFDLI